MTLHHLPAMNGFAGLSQSKNRKQENIISNGYKQSLRKENADHAVGPVVVTAKIGSSYESKTTLFHIDY